MNKLGDSSLIVVAITLVVAGLFLHWDLIDWLIDAVGLLFIVGGVGAGIAAFIKMLTRRGVREGA